MFDGCNGVVDHHSWACPAHYISNLLAHVGAVAVNRATFTCWLLISIFTSVKPLVCIHFKIFVLGGHRVTLKFMLAV